jgi:hypothetical protein
MTVSVWITLRFDLFQFVHSSPCRRFSSDYFLLLLWSSRAQQENVFCAGGGWLFSSSLEAAETDASYTDGRHSEKGEGDDKPAKYKKIDSFDALTGLP